MSCQQLTQLKIESLINNPTWIGMLELFPSGFRLFRQLWPTTTFTPCNLFVSLDVYWVVMQPRGSNWCHQKVTTHSAICERIISYEITKHLKFLPCQSEGKCCSPFEGVLWTVLLTDFPQFLLRSHPCMKGQTVSEQGCSRPHQVIPPARTESRLITINNSIVQKSCRTAFLLLTSNSHHMEWFARWSKRQRFTF